MTTRSDLVVSTTEATESGARPFDEQFRQEFARRYASLFRYVDRLSGDPDLAADIAQEAFIRLYRRRELPGDTGSWLAVVARNLFHNARSKSARRRVLLEQEQARRSGVDDDASPEADFETARKRKMVRSALEALPQRERELLILRYEGYSYREMSRILDINEPSVGTLLARAKEAFRMALEGHDDATP